MLGLIISKYTFFLLIFIIMKQEFINAIKDEKSIRISSPSKNF